MPADNRQLTLPQTSTSLSGLEQLARKAVLQGLGRWRHGHLALRLPDGQTVELGDPAAAERAAAVIHDDSFFARILFSGEVGAGEAYVDGLWDADDLTALLRLFVRNLEALRFDTPLARLGQLASLLRHKLRRNTTEGSERNIHAHYDLGNDFYRLFLDETMAYSCAIFEPGDTLEAAQQRKYQRIAAKLRLGPRDHLLEIGSGWGGFAIHAAQSSGCRVTTVTVSREQHRLATERVAAAGLSDRVEVRYADYRTLTGQYDRIVSIEMFEAVGYAYWPSFFRTAARLLSPTGIMVLQTIAMPDQRFERYRQNVDWTQKYIFPGACIPALGAMTLAMAKGSDLEVHGVEDIGPSYAPTLRAWRERFRARLDQVQALGMDDRFVRMWEMYLGFSEASFAERTLSDLQLVLSHAGNRTL